jgi:predicted CoA-binding protein
MTQPKSLDPFFHPRGIAIVGASSRVGSPGYQIVRNGAGMNFRGTIYPINPAAGEIGGLKCYKSVIKIPGNVDLALLMLPAARCNERGAVTTDVALRLSRAFDTTPELANETTDWQAIRPILNIAHVSA